MLCRALLVAVALSYVLCVLLLSGVQKEDIDASTLRKLQRHNVNIDDIDGQQLRKQCLVKTNIPVTALTQENSEIKKKELSLEKVGSQVEDRSKLRKILEYLEYNSLAEKRNVLKKKDNTPTLTQGPNSKLQASSSFGKRNINVEDTSSEKSDLRGIPIAKEDDEKTSKANINKKLDNFMNIWQTSIGRITKTTHQESTTVKVIKANIISKNTKDVEYITKIVEGILSKKELNNLMSANTENKSTYYNSNVTFREADQVSSAKSKNETSAATKYVLNNCKLGNFYGNNQDDIDKHERLGNDQQLSSGIKVPVINSNNDDYILCKRVEAKENNIITDQIQNNVVHNILNKLNQEILRFKPSDKVSAIRSLIENQLKSADFNQPNIHDTTSNIHEKRMNTLDNEIITPVKNQSESIISNRQDDRMKTWDTYKDGFDLLDVERAGALESALKTQTNIYNQIFSRQRDLLQMSNTDKERIKQLEKERRKELQSALIAHPSTFSNKLSEQDGDLEIWRSTYLNTLNNQKQTMVPRENMEINNVPYIQKETSTNTVNTMEYEPKRPWFYSGGQLRTKNKEKLKGVFFKPIDDKKITNTEPSHKYTTGKKWSPYFDILDKNSSTTETDEIETPKIQKTILVDSYRLVQLNNKEISQEITENNKMQSNVDILYQNKNESPNIMTKERSSEQFETKKDKKPSQSNCQTIYETRRECLPDAEYKSNWAYFRNKKIEKQRTNVQENSKESNFNYQFPSKPRTTKSSYGKYITEDELDTKNSNKFPEFPQNVIKDIANSIKEIVLKGLITTTIIPITTISSTTSSSPMTTTTTTTPKATISTSKMTTTTIKPTDETSTAENKQQLKIQDASKAMERIMEMLEKINSFKDKIEKHENVTYGNFKENVRYDTKKIEATTQTILNRPEQPAHQKSENYLEYDPQSLQPNPENQTPYVPQPFQPNTENREPYPQQHLQYIPQTVQMKHENVTSYVLPALQLRAANRLPYVPQPIQSHSESRTPYFPPIVENRLPYPKNLQSNLENRNPYFPQPLQYAPNVVQQKTQNHIPYIPQAAERKTDNRTPYVPEPVQLKPEKENLLPYNPQNLQSNPENLTPYFPQSLQIKSENRVPYDPQLLQRSPDNHAPYEQQPVQSNIGNGIPYDPQPSQSNPDNSVASLPQPLQYAPNVAQQKTENRIPYDPQPLQRNPVIQYAVKNPYYNSKIELDPYQDKEVLEPIKQKVKPRKYAITLQTNSGEIAPLKIAVHKPVLQTIVLTTKSPTKVQQTSEEIFNGRKPKTISKRHQAHQPKESVYQDDKPKESAYQDDRPKETGIRNNGDNKQYSSRHSHREAYVDHPKPRKIKKEREANHEYKPRDRQGIERFHEKLERGEVWPRYNEEKIAKRVQRPIVKNNNYDDTHFRNFLQTQQKVNAMLERILATSKSKPISTEVI